MKYISQNFIFLCSIAVISFCIPLNEVHADTFMIMTANGATTFIANLDKSNYAPNDSITVTSSVSTTDPYVDVVFLEAGIPGYPITTILNNEAINTGSLFFRQNFIGKAPAPGSGVVSFNAWVNENVPPDLCANISGIQATLASPSGVDYVHPYDQSGTYYPDQCVYSDGSYTPEETTYCSDGSTVMNYCSAGSCYRDPLTSADVYCSPPVCSGVGGC